ncbi:TRAP transporter DctM subunit [Octadecabacter arcticus 238]|jgi:tripartite ATP-independent transporter DctM subunit|uniref:TRAP transporter large permease protein n=1 Tax=Octadecabacter arcticus 238 TaxID=391616 RepID=M9RJJ1_9RHOB|nr:TRAP transporter large permease [Octadecabacter arcticus]AGI71938.1 TRAP transporter DctM subunit [Octadecabacter arcticus 238]
MLVLFGTLALLLVIGLPVALALAGASLLFLLLESSIPPVVVLHRMINGVDSFTLLAVPFFILAGSLMNHAGITDRIFAFAKSLVGWMRGGLGHVNIGASVLFAGMSGAAVADAGGLGMIEIKAMKEGGYDADFAVGVTAASSTIGPLIPPSLPLVVYGVVSSTSIGQLFAAGLVPGLIMAIALMLMVSWYAYVRGYGRDSSFAWVVLWHTFKRAFLSLLTPIIIVGGILAGLFTPTEAAIAACAYALFLGVFVYRTLNFRKIRAISMDTIETTAIVLLIVAAASIFSWILTTSRVTETVAELILGHTQNVVLVLLLINILLLIVGFFMEPVAAITILTPVLLPLVVELGVDPVHFGIMMVLNLMLGLLTPPVGMVLYVLARVADIKFESAASATAPFLIPLGIVLLLITYVPALSMWLPTLLYR